MEGIALLLFIIVIILILFGYPVAITLGGISVLAGLIFFDIDFFYLVSLRIFGIMNNFVLLAVPLFIFMGLTLEKSGIAEKLLETMAILFGKIRGGLAYSVILVGGMLAASTGIVGATVVTMGLISLPTMLRRGYSPQIATVDKDLLRRMYNNEPMSANMNYKYFMDQQMLSTSTKYQLPSNPLLNPFAWVKFIKAIKRGDFKKKD